MQTFTKPFTQQESIPEDGIERAVDILRSGRLHRYNVAADEESEASCLEREYAAYQGVKYCIATASGGQAIQLGLRVCGVRPGDRVLANAYTLAPVPGAIHNLGAEPVLVEIVRMGGTDTSPAGLSSGYRRSGYSGSCTALRVFKNRQGFGYPASGLYQNYLVRPARIPAVRQLTHALSLRRQPVDYQRDSLPQLQRNADI